MPATSAESSLTSIASRFPLPWSAYVRLLSVKNINAREFYETEALRDPAPNLAMCEQIHPSKDYELIFINKFVNF